MSWDQRSEHDWWYGLAEGAVDLAPYGDAVPAAVRAALTPRTRIIHVETPGNPTTRC